MYVSCLIEPVAAGGAASDPALMELEARLNNLKR
jgi:hypothetical protein